LDAPYEPATAASSWFKIKRAHTLDLIVLAAEWGWPPHRHHCPICILAPWTCHGRIRHARQDIQGLTDATLEWQTRELLARETHRDQ